MHKLRPELRTCSQTEPLLLHPVRCALIVGNARSHCVDERWSHPNSPLYGTHTCTRKHTPHTHRCALIVIGNARSLCVDERWRNLVASSLERRVAWGATKPHDAFLEGVGCKLGGKLGAYVRIDSWQLAAGSSGSCRTMHSWRG